MLNYLVHMKKGLELPDNFNFKGKASLTFFGIAFPDSAL